MDDRANQPPGEPSQARAFGVIFCFSLLVLLAGPFGNVSAVGTLDPWFYTGYFQNFPELVERYGAPYYVTRLPYILPGVLLYSVLTPPVANLVLNALQLTAVLTSLFLILHRQFGRTTALIGVAAAAGNACVAGAIGWDYPDGPAIAYVFLGAWLALAPPPALPNRWALPLAGACWTMAGLTNLIAGIIILSSAVTIVIWHGRSFRQTAWDLLGVAAGAVVCLGIWCAVARLTIGTWNILGPQWGQLAYAATHPEHLPDLWGRGYEWVKSAYRLLAPPCVLLAGGLALLPAYRASPHRRALLAAWAGLGVAAGIFCYAEFGAHKILLRVAYHSSYLIAPLLLCLAAVIGLVLHHLSARKIFQAGLVGGLVLVLVLPALFRGHRGLPLFGAYPWPVLATAGVLTLGLGARRWPLAPALGLLALGFISSQSMVLDNGVAGYAFTPKEAVFFPDPSQRIEAGEVAYQHELAADFIVLLKNARIRHKTVCLWYDPDEPRRWLFDSLGAQYLWANRDYADAFAHRPLEELLTWFSQDSRVLHVTSDPRRIAAHRVLLERRGFQWREAGTWNLGRRGASYRLVLDEITLPAAPR